MAVVTVSREKWRPFLLFAIHILFLVLLLSFFLEFLYTRESDSLIDVMWHNVCDFLYLTLRTRHTDELIIINVADDDSLDRHHSFIACMHVCAVCVRAQKFQIVDEITKERNHQTHSPISIENIFWDCIFLFSVHFGMFCSAVCELRAIIRR